MESPLSQESINMPKEEYIRFQTELTDVRSARPVKVRSAGCDYV